MTEIFIFVAGASIGACFGIFIAALMASASRESESRMKETYLQVEFCPAEDCIGCENTKCIMHPVDDDD